MTTYQISGSTIVIPGDGTVNTDTLDANAAINPITGSFGVNTVRIVNSSAANIAAVTWTPQDVTYSFDNVAYTASDAGANAVINVTAAFDGYTIEVVDAGDGFIETETLTVLGSALGGTTTANDLVITVDAVTVDGAITSASLAGTPLWPQSTTSEVSIFPSKEDFIQVTNAPSVGVYFTSNCADGNLYITPVNVVG